LTAIRLRLLDGAYAVWQTSDEGASATVEDGLLSVTRTNDEVSVVGPAALAPSSGPVESGWRCLEVAGPLSFELTGVLSSLSAPLSKAGIPIFAISTFNTDYLLVKEVDSDRAIEVLRHEGFVVDG
jgi:hypothetical protein